MTEAAPQEEYRVLALKYRPQTFADVVGQSAVVRQLQGEIREKRVGHAYLFTGPRGVGKTSMARIFAKALNCVDGPTPDPCGRCAHCLGIANDSDLDVAEVDAATYTKKEETVELLEGIDRVAFSARYKVYIIDEVHMFSSHSFNVLLKRLEEPPPRVVFILATTNPEKIPETVLSRCRRLEFDRFETGEIVGRLREIADREKIQFADGERDKILEALALASEGGMRDAQVSFDQLISLSEGVVSFESARQLLGVVESDLLHRLLLAMVERQTVESLMIVHELVEKGRDLQRFIKTFTGYLRDAMMLKANAPEELLKVARTNPGRLRDAVAKVSTPALLNMMQQFLDLEVKMKSAAPPRFLLEFALMKLTAIHPSFVLDAMDPQRLRDAGPPAREAASQSAPSQPRAQMAADSGSRPMGGGSPRANDSGTGPTMSARALQPAAAPMMHASSSALALPDVVLDEAHPLRDDSGGAEGSDGGARIISVLPTAEEMDRFLSLAGEKLPMLRSSINAAKVIFDGAETLVLELSEHDSYMKGQFERPERVLLLAESARTAFGRRLRLRISVAPADESPQFPRAESRDEPDEEPHVIPLATPRKAVPRANDAELEVRLTSFRQALDQYPDLRAVVDLVRNSLGVEPVAFNGKRLQG